MPASIIHSIDSPSFNNSTHPKNRLESNFQCLLLNARSLCNKLSEFNTLIYTANPSLIAVTESWLNDSVHDALLDPVNIYNIFRHDRKSRGGGVCLLLEKKIKCIEIATVLDVVGIELLCIDIINSHVLTRIILCYRSTSMAHESLDNNMKFIRCLEKLTAVNHCVILLGDFNLPGISWNADSLPSDVIHLKFLEYFYSSGLRQFNIIPTRNNAILDLIFSNDHSIVSDLCTLPPLASSDHDVISFSIIISFTPNPNFKPRPTLNYSKCNYDLLILDLNSIDWHNIFSSCTTADDYWNTFSNTLHNLLSIHCPSYLPTDPNKRKVVLFPIAIKRLQARKKKLWRKMRTSASSSLSSEYKSACNAYRQAVRQFHLDRESKVLNSHESSDLFKFVRNKLNRSSSIPPLADSFGNVTSDPSLKANLFNDFFSSVYTADDTSLPLFPNRPITTNCPLNHVSFTYENILPKLLRLKKSVTLSPDGFPPILFRNCAHQLATPLSKIFSAIFDHSELPTCWLSSTVFPLHKKGERKDVSNYRPISLISTSCKVMESVIHDDISNFLLANNLLSDHQHGFIKNRSTLTNLITSIRNWLSSLDNRKSTDVIYIDFAKAFDSISHPKLLHKIKSYGISGKLFSWISAWLSNRSQSVKLDGCTSLPSLVLSGVLQGSVLGPLLFLVFINDLIEILPPQCHPSLFADDLKLYSDCDTTPVPNSPGYVFCPLLQTALNSLFHWSTLWQLSISIPKCSCLSISNLKSPLPRLYNINSIPIPQVASSSDLGVIIDDKLSFSSHVLSIAKKAYSKTFLISRCFLSKNPKLLATAFSIYVRPLLDYCSPIWSPHLLKDINIIENVQRRFSKTFYSLRNLPYSARLNRLGLSSLVSRRIKFDLCFCYKITRSLTILDYSLFFSYRPSNITRGHQYMLAKPSVRLNICKFAFFSRVVDHWNDLHPDIVIAGLYSSFKSRLKSLRIQDDFSYLPD